MNKYKDFNGWWNDNHKFSSDHTKVVALQAFEYGVNGMAELDAAELATLRARVEEAETERDTTKKALKVVMITVNELRKALERAEQTIRNLGNGWLTGDGRIIALNEAANIRTALK
jgi:hypothetical protein